MPVDLSDRRRTNEPLDRPFMGGLLVDMNQLPGPGAPVGRAMVRRSGIVGDPDPPSHGQKLPDPGLHALTRPRLARGRTSPFRHTTPQPPGTMTWTAPNHMASGDGRTVIASGGIHYDHSCFRPWLDPLAEAARLVYYDHRGTGQSVDGVHPEQLDDERWIEDIELLRKAVGTQSMLLLGHSYGGFLAQQYALRHPDRLDGLILCCTAPAMDYMEVVTANAAARGTPEILEAVQEAFTRPVADDSRLRELWRTLLPLYFHRYDAAVGREMDRKATYSAGAFNRAFFHCLPLFSAVGELHRIRVPVLVLAGRHDWICPPQQGAVRIGGELPNSETVIFEESGHFPFIEERERFVSTVAHWIRALPDT